MLSTKTRRSANRAAKLLRLAAVNVGNTQTALGACYRRLGARVGQAKAVTATARKLAVLFYNPLRYGMAYQDLGATYYEEQYRQRVFKGPADAPKHSDTNSRRPPRGKEFLRKAMRFFVNEPR